MVENSLVHHFYNRHEGFMQPTLVENRHHLDFKFPENGISELEKFKNSFAVTFVSKRKLKMLEQFPSKNINIKMLRPLLPLK